MTRIRPDEGSGTGAARRRGGFTLVELLVVIVIIGVLIGLLFPVIAGAMRTANEARVTAEIQILSQALAEFKNKYGDYPPSRILLSESGIFDTSVTTLIAPGDLTVGQLAERSLRYLRKFFPKLVLNPSGSALYPNAQLPGGFPDFNGNGIPDNGFYILEGHECLVFFLGGVPSASGSGMAGWAKDPRNPFINDSTAGAVNRAVPLFEFRPDRLLQDDMDNVPGYNDPLASTNASGDGNTRYYVYFSGYGQNQYDPNDANSPFEATKGFVTSHGPVSSLGPNPYTSSVALPVQDPSLPAVFTKFMNPDSFQILSSGSDGYYGIGGQFGGETSTGDRLPFQVETEYLQGTAQIKTLMSEARARERDNIANFARGRLE